MEFDWVMRWVGLLVQSFYFAVGWVGLKKLDPRTTMCKSVGVVFAEWPVIEVGA